MISQAVENVIASVKHPWQFGRLCDTSQLVVPLSTPSTSATLSHFNTIDNDAQIVPHSRVYHISSDYYHNTNSGNQSLCSEKQIINSNSADTDNKSIFASLPNIDNLQILETMVTVPIRSDSVQYDTVLLYHPS